MQELNKEKDLRAQKRMQETTAAVCGVAAIVSLGLFALTVYNAPAVMPFDDMGNYLLWLGKEIATASAFGVFSCISLHLHNKGKQNLL